MIFPVAISVTLAFSFALNRYTRPHYFIVCLAVFPMYFLQAFQNGVGTDYENYRAIVENTYGPDLYLRKGEFLFYWIVSVIRTAGLPTQTLFVVYSVLFLTLNAYMITRLAVMTRQSASIVIILFFLSSNLYFNQYNGLRQYLSASFFSVAMLLLLDNKRVQGYCSLILVGIAHSTGVAIAPLTFMIKKLRPWGNFKFFLAILFAFQFSADLIVQIIFTYLIPDYSHYLYSAYASGMSLSSFLLRLYDLPIIGLFWFFYLKSNSPIEVDPKLIFLFSMSYWLSVLSLKFGFVFRMEPYFEFTQIYVYAITIRYLERLYPLSSSLAMLYLILPGILKVFVFARGEYLYTLN